MRILITGATGFVGSEIVRELSEKERFELFLTARQNSSDNTNYYQVDISDVESVKQLERLEKLDIIIHSAGLAHQFGKVEKKEFWKVNVEGTENICNLAVSLSVKHFILISSVSVYGNYGSLEVTEDFKCNAKGEYAQSKRFSELKAIEICKKNSIKLTVLRLGTVIGENDRGNTARLITQINNNRFIWIGKGKNRKTLVYKKDVAEIIGKIVENEEFEAGTFNLVAKPLAMKKIVEIIFENLGKKKPKIFLPEQIVRKFFIINKILNIDLLERLEKIVDKWLSDEIFSGKKIFLQHNLAPKTEIGDALKKQISAFEPE